jgi:hypothetical protein
VLAVAEAAVDADRPALFIDRDDGVHAIRFARAAVIFDGFTRAMAAT